jgi:acyl-coenzyme A synthetase/AMP-(fatty) acid ligase
LEILVLNERCEPGETGQLVHRGATVALGYWNDPEATAQVFRPHPLRPPGTPDSERVVFSGDLVYQDEDGDLFFVSRKDKLIKTLGYRVSPDEVAEALYGSDEVLGALVTSEPDELRGARIVANVVLAEDGRLDRLKAFCARGVSAAARSSRSCKSRPGSAMSPRSSTISSMMPSAGVAALAGQFEPSLFEALAQRWRRCFLHLSANFLVHSRNPEVLNPILLGRAMITRMDGERWMGHHLEPFD